MCNCFQLLSAVSYLASVVWTCIATNVNPVTRINFGYTNINQNFGIHEKVDDHEKSCLPCCLQRKLVQSPLPAN
jgi:hypothetical protein